MFLECSRVIFALRTVESANKMGYPCSQFLRKPPLCKGRWHGVSRDGGIVIDRFTQRTIPQSPHGDSSLYTKEPIIKSEHRLSPCILCILREAKRLPYIER